MTKVSILMTTYNCEKYVGQAIMSVINQDMPFEWELLIGDDGSSDETMKIISSWIEKYPNNIRLFVMDRSDNGEKSGTRASRNRANLLENAVGEYLIFLDGDDQFLGTEKIKRQVEILDSEEGKNCSCVAHDIIANNIMTGEKKKLTDSNIANGVINEKRYWKDLYFHTNTIMFRKCCVKMMLEPSYRDFLNDNFITYIILQYGKIYYLSNAWAQYNLTGDGLWTGKKRTYGCFRNMIIFDLELLINRSFRKECLIRHIYDIRYLFKHYTLDDREYISPLFLGLDKSTFHYSYLMFYESSEMKMNQRIEKKWLYLKSSILQMAVSGLRVFTKTWKK